MHAWSGHTHKYTHTHTHTHTQTRTCKHINTLIHLQTLTETQTHSYTHKHTRAHTHTHARTHARTHAHTQTHRQSHTAYLLSSVVTVVLGVLPLWKGGEGLLCPTYFIMSVVWEAVNGQRHAYRVVHSPHSVLCIHSRPTLFEVRTTSMKISSLKISWLSSIPWPR